MKHQTLRASEESDAWKSAQGERFTTASTLGLFAEQKKLCSEALLPYIK